MPTAVQLSLQDERFVFLGSIRPLFHVFQYPDQDPCPEDLNADALFYVLVSIKRIVLFLTSLFLLPA